MSWKRRFWKYATAIVVVLIVLNPETVHFALFLDAIGLDIFLLLLEVQIFAMVGIFVTENVKPMQAYLKRHYLQHVLTFSRNNFRENLRTLVFSVPSQAAVMHLLVFSAAIGMVFGVNQ